MSLAGLRQAAQRRRGSATPRLPRSTAARIGGAAVAMIVVAEVAVWLLGPREERPTRCRWPRAITSAPAELERADDYRGGQRLLLVAGIAVEGAVLVAVAFGRPAPRAPGARPARRRGRCSAPPPPAPASRC